MPRKYTFESEPGEQEPLDSHSYQRPQQPPSSQNAQYNDLYYDEPRQSSRTQHVRQRSSSRSRSRPAYSNQPPQDHGYESRPPPVSRRYSQGRHTSASAAEASAAVSPMSADSQLDSSFSPPQPPPHRQASLHQQQYPPYNVTPGADNFSEAAAGGISGIAYSVAERNARESGLEALRGMPPQQRQQQRQSWAEYGAVSRGSDQGSHDSLQGLSQAAQIPGNGTPGQQTPSRSPPSFVTDIYTDDPYQGYTSRNPRLGMVNPNEIADDGDDGLDYTRNRGVRTSMMSIGGHSRTSSNSQGPGASGGVIAPAALGAAAIGAAGAAGGAASIALTNEAASKGAFGGRAARRTVSNRIGSSGVKYSAVGAGVGTGMATAYRGGGSDLDNLSGGGGKEKSEWLLEQDSSLRRWRWVIIIALVLLAVAGIVLGVVFGVVLKHKNSSSSSSSSSASGDTSTNGDLNINSKEIQALLNNKNLHKVFPGIDYTPINTQYPDCLENPPSQNNVTRDVAVLSQLTNTIRLYGTDCNQTEMTIHAIKQLQMEDTIKIWMGVWQDGNTTTNARQLSQMWDILDNYGADHFKGVIVANEILFRKQMTVTELSTLLTSVRANLTKRSMDLPVATSDLGDSWTAALAEASDYVMANIHPFFSGVNALSAANWTYDFWETNNGPFFKTNASQNIISETGWPSQGGTDCGSGSTETSCPNASVAGISEMNQFMEDWVCAALTNGTQYFWFEAFDEPWKIEYDSGDENWEDHWGLMDVDRNLKTGVTIPDCGGMTV